MPSASDDCSDLLDAIRASPLFANLSPLTRAALAAELRHEALAPGDALFPESERIDALYFLRSGSLRATESPSREEGGGEEIVRVINPGDAVDQVQVLSGREHPVRVRAVAPSVLVMVPGAAVDRLVAAFDDFRAGRDRLHRRQLLCRLHAIFGPLDERFLDDLEQTADGVHLQRDEVLFEQNDPGDRLFFVISGRVQTVRCDRNGTERVVAEAGRGETVGEIEFFTGEARRTRVRAARDSMLVRFTDTAFEALVGRHPSILRRVVRNVVEQSHRPAPAGLSAGRVATVAVVPIGPGAPVADFSARLAEHLARFGPVRRLTAAGVDASMAEPGISQAGEDSPASERLLAWLETREAESRFLLYEAGPTASPWARRCLRLADRILLVGRAGDDPRPGDVERALFPDGRARNAHEMLVLVHPDGTCPPSGTRRWLEPRRHVEEHHHIRWNQEEDFARLARVLAGRAVGLVLGGGGARGFAHIGALKALAEAGIPVDMVGGTSMGASIAAQVAMGWSPEHIEEINRRVWIEIRPHRKLTLPFLSVVGNRESEACGRMMYGDLEIEDLWIPFFCVSSNLTTAEMMVHRSGSLLWAATASASLPGFAVPVVSGKHLLVDGALLNNLPTDVMRSLGAGTVIASEVSVEEDATFVAERIPTPWEVMRGRARFPSLMEVVLRASMLHSTYLERAAIQDADLCLRPPVDHFSLMDFPRLAEFVAVGYEYTRQVLQHWPGPATHRPKPTAAPLAASPETPVPKTGPP